MDIVLIGGTIESLLVAEFYAQKHNVFVLEMEAELGLPALHPGRVMNVELLQSYFTKEQQSFLSLFANAHGWGCRWDWVLKHLAANVARQGVQFLTRTRILSSTKHHEKILLELTSSERDKPVELFADRLILFSETSPSGPGGKTHCLEPFFPEKFDTIPTITWFGGTILTTDLTTLTSADLQIQRGDGMTELWWRDSPTWVPPHGFIEQCRCELSPDISHLSFDSVVSRVHEFVRKTI